MRTELQDRIDKEKGLQKISYEINEETGKIIEKGEIMKEFDGENLEKMLSNYEQQIKDMESQLETAKEKLKACEAIEETDELNQFIEMQKKAGLLQQKKGLVEAVKNREEELQYHKDSCTERNELLAKWRDWKAKSEKNPNAN